MMSAIHRLRRRASGRAQDEAGFTMVEMVIAIFIFAMVITGVGVGMSSALNLTRQNRNRSIAANLAAQQMDTIRSTDFATLDQMTQPPQTVTLPTTTIEGVPYTMIQYTHWVRKNDTGAAAGPCQSPPTAANPLAYIAITTTVSWNDMHGVLPVADAHRHLASGRCVRPDGGPHPRHRPERGRPPVSGALVSISNPAEGVSDSATTASDGCAFFAYQPTGAYTVTLSSAVGKVDGQGSITPTQTVTVKSASTSCVQFLFDTAGHARAHVDAEDGRIPDPGDRGIRRAVDGEGYLANTAPPAVRQGAVRDAHGARIARSHRLFPYSAGFQAWAGTCSDADPQGVNSLGAPYYPGAIRDPATAMTPGVTTPGSVTLPSTSLQFKRTSAGSATYTAARRSTPRRATPDVRSPRRTRSRRP